MIKVEFILFFGVSSLVNMMKYSLKKEKLLCLKEEMAK